MFGECHAHLFMDGIDYHAAVAAHKNGPDEICIRRHLQAYKDCGVTYVREGGDHYGVSEKARELAGEYGIEYRTPVFAIHKKGHYGKIVGYGVETLAEFHEKVLEVRRRKGDFIKIMVSGIMEYDEFGKLSEAALEKEWIREMIHIAHEEGFAVMVHANGREAVLPAVLAGADSIEHGNYIDTDCMDAMAQCGCVWVPTIVTTGNLIGCGRYDDRVLERIFDMECRNLAYAFEKGVNLAAGSDAGAYMVPHGRGIERETEIFLAASGAKPETVMERLAAGERKIRRTFRIEQAGNGKNT